jgi:ribonucleotide monophosphatase NagD (HAD superfamily)
VLDDAGLNPKDVLVVGDRLDTDLESGRRAGCPTFLVLSGVTSAAPEGQEHGQDIRSLL